MMRAGAMLVLAAAAAVLPGCVAVPIAAAGVLAREQMRSDQPSREERRSAKRERKGKVAIESQASPAQPIAPVPRLPGIMAADTVPNDPSARAAGSVPAGMQYLYGSGEAAALSVQAYQQLWTYLAARAGDRRAGREIAAVVLAEGSTLAAPRFASCGSKPLAVVLDVDETAILNLGYEADDARRGGGYDEARWRRWEQTGADKVLAVPGAVETLAAARRADIIVVFNSNRSAANAAQTAAALDHAELGPAEIGKTLWLRAEGAPSGKDLRRWEIAERYCVVALVGDQLGDFSDLFNAADASVPARRNAATQTMIAPLWGAGWFILPNPVYGTALKGGIDDIFPAETQWTDPGAAPQP